MVAIGIIPARFGSTRFPGKPLKKIAGRPLIEHVILGVKKATSFSDVIVATDHAEIANVAIHSGARAIMTDSELPSGTDRVWQAYQRLIANNELKPVDVIVNIQGDEPLIQCEPLESLIAAFTKDQDLAIATLGRPLDISNSEDLIALRSPSTAKIVVDQKGHAIYFSRFPIPFSRILPEEAKSQGVLQTESVLKHIGIYAYRPSFLRDFCESLPSEIEQFEGLEQLRALSLGAKIFVVRTNHESWGVDTPEDVEKIEKMMELRS